jgi:hypothetical protein
MFFDRQQQALAQRQQQLQTRNAVLRQRLGQDVQALRAPLALADQVRSGWRWLQVRPQWLAVGVTVLMVWRPRRAWRLAGRLWAGWRLWRRLQRWSASLAPLLPHARGPRR